MITWAEITTEIQEDEDYRQVLVRIFRKYEGQGTDERDKSNRVIKVTAAAFARHMGIPKQTFDHWLNPPTPTEVSPNTGPTSPEQPTEPSVSPKEQRPANVRPAPRPNPAPDPEPREIRTPAERKADHALIEEQMQPLRDAIKDLPRSFMFPCLIGTFEECVGELDEALADPRFIEKGFITEDDIQQAYSVIGQISERLMQLELALSGSRK